MKTRSSLSGTRPRFRILPCLKDAKNLKSLVINNVRLLFYLQYPKIERKVEDIFCQSPKVKNERVSALQKVLYG